jgi:hypothetical protein
MCFKQMWKHDLTSVIQALTVLFSVHMSIGERLASKFVTLKTKNLVTRKLEDGFEECRFTLHAWSS